MNIYFDLDGTLLDSRERLFRLFCDLTNQKILDFDEYWNLKRAMNDHRKILTEYLHFTSDNIDLFETQWLELIESETYLLLDKPFVFTEDVLKSLFSKDFKLYVVTARQDRYGVLKQLNDYGLVTYFSNILVTESIQTKAQLILESGITLTQNDLLVGDTGMDIKTAKQIGIKSMAVLSGFRNMSVLQQYNSDYIGNDIRSILNYV